MLVITDIVSFREICEALYNQGKRLKMTNAVTGDSFWVSPQGQFNFIAFTCEGNERSFITAVDGVLRFADTPDGKATCSLPIGNFTFHIFPGVNKETL